MRTETRQIMIEEEVYIADDGKEFDDEDDCIAYEITRSCEKIKMRDYRWAQTDDVENCQTVKLDNLDEIKSFIELCKYSGVSHKGIEAPGVYLYTEGRWGACNEAWTNISEMIKSFEESEEINSGN